MLVLEAKRGFGVDFFFFDRFWAFFAMQFSERRRGFAAAMS